MRKPLLREGLTSMIYAFLTHDLNHIYGLFTRSFRSICAFSRICACSVDSTWNITGKRKRYNLWGLKLSARFSLTSYSLWANFFLAQSVFLLSLWFLCLVSALKKGKMHKKSCILNPIKLNPFGGAWLILKETMIIPRNRNSQNGVTIS